MKKTLKSLCAIILSFVLLLGLTGCGEEKTNNGNGNNDGGSKQQEQGENEQPNNGVSDNLAWPDNDFTKQVPKPEQSFSQEAMTDDVTCFVYPLWTVEQAKSYAQTLVSKGYTVSSTYVDTADDYMAVYKNADGSYQVTLAASKTETDGGLTIAIPLDKR